MLLRMEVQTNVKFEIVMQTAATHIAKCTLTKIPIAKCTLAKIPIATWPYTQFSTLYFKCNQLVDS